MGAFDVRGSDSGAPGLLVTGPEGRLYRFAAPVLDADGSAIPGSSRPDELVCSGPAGAPIGAVAWTSLDRDGDGLEELVGLTPRADCGRSEPASLMTLYPSLKRFDEPKPLAGIGAVIAVARADVDGDGQADLIASDDQGVHALAGPESGEPRLLFSVQSPAALTRIQADSDPADEIALVTGTQVVVIDPDSSGQSAQLFWEAGFGGKTVAAADVTADGVEDLLLGDGRQLRVLLAVPRLPAPAGGTR
jgi:hypothetical protein